VSIEIRFQYDIISLKFHSVSTRIFHALEVYSGKALRDDAAVIYRESLITQPMETSGSALRMKSFLHFIRSRAVANCTPVVVA
jgi:hypothetical protein